MTLSSDLLDALSALNPHIDATKSTLELDDVAKSISNILAEPYGLFWLEYISENLECGKLPIYSSNKYAQKGKLDILIELLYKAEKHNDLRAILPFYHELFGYSGITSDDPGTKYSTLKKLESSRAIKAREDVACFCLKCYEVNAVSVKTCSKCISDDLLTITKNSMLPQVRTILSNGQYLEMYLKYCLASVGVELIGYPTGQKGKKAFTNIRYQVDGDAIEVDVHGTVLPLTLLLCEAKTSTKISLNELRRLEGLYDRLVEKINRSSGRQFSVLRLFVITGQFDENIPRDSYKRKGWELIDRESIEYLKDVLKVIKSSL